MLRNNKRYTPVIMSYQPKKIEITLPNECIQLIK